MRVCECALTDASLTSINQFLVNRINWRLEVRLNVSVILLDLQVKRNATETSMPDETETYTRHNTTVATATLSSD